MHGGGEEDGGSCRLGGADALTGISTSEISRIGPIGSGLALCKELSEAFTLLPGVGVCAVFCTSLARSATSRGLFMPLAFGIIERSPCAEVMFRVAGGRPPVPGAGFFDLKRNDMAAGAEEAGQGGCAARCGQ